MTRPRSDRTPRRLLLLQAAADVLGETTGVAVAMEAAKVAAPAGERALYERYAKGNAGTGTPIKTLHGVARDRAIRSNAGGGRQDAGGGGMPRGDRRLDAAGVRAGLAAAGIEVGVETAVRIAVRYARLLREDRKPSADA